MSEPHASTLIDARPQAAGSESRPPIDAKPQAGRAEHWRTRDAAFIDEQLRLAAQVQADLLPEPLPDTGPLNVSTLFLPADYVSGDIYDVARLDETRLAISIADATGHGLPAALLTVLIRRSLRGKEIFDHTYRIIEPDELLGRLNDDLIDARLSQCQFVTAIHAIFDRMTQHVRWARGGCPYPILVRPGEPARQIRSEGGLIGAFRQEYETIGHHLRPGDVLVFYTDGLEALLLDCRHHPERTILHTDWCRQLESEGPEAAIDSIRRLSNELDETDWPTDDITLIALRMN